MERVGDTLDEKFDALQARLERLEKLTNYDGQDKVISSLDMMIIYPRYGKRSRK